MSLHIVSGLQLDNYVALAAFFKGNYSRDMLNLSMVEINFTSQDMELQDPPLDYITSLPAVKAFFYCLYIIIFVVGICGNVLVCYVVFRNKSMQTVTNYFITNLAFSDILLCAFAVPFTPLYTLMREWIFGRVLCHLVVSVQGVSVYISAFTLMSIAIDRFFVIIYPFKPRLKISICLSIIVLVFISAALLTLPYGYFVDVMEINNKTYCDEVWPSEQGRKAFGFTTSILQFVVPFIIISFCYMRVCIKLRDRARFKPGAKSVKKEELEKERAKRTNRMLISMVVIFGLSWMPLNLNNLITDFYIPASTWHYSTTLFLLSHATAMSSTCYNPFLYAWLNENFRKEFKQVLPCFRNDSANRRLNSAKTERTCNGQDAPAVQDTLLPQHQQQTFDKEAPSVQVPLTQAPSPPQNKKPTAAKYSSDTDTVKLHMAEFANESV